MPRVTLATLFVFLGLSVMFDINVRRIPNGLSGPGILVGLILNAAHSGTSGILASLAGVGVTIGILIWPFATGGIGGGGGKMMGAGGGVVWPPLAPMGLLFRLITSRPLTS